MLKNKLNSLIAELNVYHLPPTKLCCKFANDFKSSGSTTTWFFSISCFSKLLISSDVSWNGTDGSVEKQKLHRNTHTPHIHFHKQHSHLILLITHCFDILLVVLNTKSLIEYSCIRSCITVVNALLTAYIYK